MPSARCVVHFLLQCAVQFLLARVCSSQVSACHRDLEGTLVLVGDTSARDGKGVIYAYRHKTDSELQQLEPQCQLTSVSPQSHSFGNFGCDEKTIASVSLSPTQLGSTHTRGFAYLTQLKPLFDSTAGCAHSAEISIVATLKFEALASFPDQVSDEKR